MHVSTCVCVLTHIYLHLYVAFKWQDYNHPHWKQFKLSGTSCTTRSANNGNKITCKSQTLSPGGGGGGEHGPT